MSKIYVIDTSTIAYDPFCFESFKENTVVIPIPVLEELDKLKKFYDEAGKNSRIFLRNIDKLIEKAGDLSKGIKINNGILLRIETNIKVDDKLGSPLYGDNRILSCAIGLSKEHKQHVILVSKDIALRVRAKAYNIASQDYNKDKFDISEIPSNKKNVVLEDDQIDNFYKNNKIVFSDQEIEKLQLSSNNFININDKSNSVIDHGRFNSETKEISALKKIKSVFGVSPKNIEQLFALNLLLDNDVKLVMLSGGSGTGKTLLALAAGLYNLLETKKYEKLIIMKPIQSVGKEIGALPGSKEEKLAPYIGSLKDNLLYLMKNSTKPIKGNKNNFESGIDPYFSLMMEKGNIEVEAIAYLRGRSLPNSFIIVDEIQNASLHELKTILTRIGEGSKIVITGDLLQIDNMTLDASNNALIHAIEKFKHYQIAGSVILTKGERSELATLASQIL